MACRFPTESHDSLSPTLRQGCIGEINLGQNSAVHGPIIAGGLNVYATKKDSADLDEISKGLKAMLQSKYRRIEIPKQPWMEDWKMPLKDYFVDLTMTHKRDTVHRHRSESVRLQEIFRPNNGIPPTRILIEGPAGFGKTTLAHKLCYDFGHGEEYIKKFEQIVLIPLREFEGTLEQMILKIVTFQDCPTDEILETLRRKQSTVAYILDGMDELSPEWYQSLIPLLKSEKYPRSTVIVTSRLGRILTENNDSSDLLHYCDTIIEIKGVTGNYRNQFLLSYLSRYPESKIISIKQLLRSKFGFEFNDESVFSKLFATGKRLFSPFLPDRTLFDSPLFLLMLFTLALESDIEAINDKTDLYKALFNFVVRRSLTKIRGTDHRVDLFHFDWLNPPSYVSLINQFGELAMEAMVTNQLTISQESVQKHFGEDKFRAFLNFGFLTQNSTIEGVTLRSWFEPVHLSLLEFAAAYYFSCSPSSALITQLCYKLPAYFLANSQSLFFSFYEGLTREKASIVKNPRRMTRSLLQDCALSDWSLFVRYVVNTAKKMDINRKTEILKVLLSFALHTSLQKEIGIEVNYDLFDQRVIHFGEMAIELLNSPTHSISRERLRLDESFLGCGFLVEVGSSGQYKPLDQCLMEFAAAYYFYFNGKHDYIKDQICRTILHDDTAKNVHNFFLQLNQNPSFLRDWLNNPWFKNRGIRLVQEASNMVFHFRRE